ncbi:hypothetical protein Tco_0635195 [Tanacetum coccineum]
MAMLVMMWWAFVHVVLLGEAEHKANDQSSKSQDAPTGSTLNFFQSIPYPKKAYGDGMQVGAHVHCSKSFSLIRSKSVRSFQCTSSFSISLEKMFSFETKDLPTAEELRSSIELSTSDYDKEKIRESLAKHSGGVVVLKNCLNDRNASKEIQFNKWMEDDLFN